MYVIREKYKDWLGNDREEDFRFNLSKSDLTKMQFSKDGGFNTYLKRIVDANNTSELMKVFEDVIEMSYGVISDDGRGFKKSKEILDDFKSTAAYDQIYMRLVTDSNFAAEFVNNVYPAELMEKAKDNPEFPDQLKTKEIEAKKA